MTHHDLTILNADGDPAAIVTISELNVEGSEELGRQATRAIERQFADEQVVDR